MDQKRLQAMISIISIMGFIVVSILCLLGAKFGQEWAGKMMETILPMVIQCWIINFTTAVNFWCGASHQQQEQSETMSRLVRKLDVDAIDLTNVVDKKHNA